MKRPLNSTSFLLCFRPNSTTNPSCLATPSLSSPSQSRDSNAISAAAASPKLHQWAVGELADVLYDDCGSTDSRICHLFVEQHLHYAELPCQDPRPRRHRYRRQGVVAHAHRGEVDGVLDSVVRRAAGRPLFLFLDPCGLVLPQDRLVDVGYADVV